MSQEHSQPHATWAQEQSDLKQRLIQVDALRSNISFVGGMDISFIKDNSTDACASLVIMSFPELHLVYEAHRYVAMELPYIPGRTVHYNDS